MKRGMKPVHPGIILNEDIIKEMGLSITAVAGLLYVSRKQLSEVINGRASITPEMARRIEKAFKVEAGLWLRLQANYDLWQVDDSGKIKGIKPLPGKKPKIRAL